MGIGGNGQMVEPVWAGTELAKQLQPAEVPVRTKIHSWCGGTWSYGSGSREVETFSKLWEPRQSSSHASYMGLGVTEGWYRP